MTAIHYSAGRSCFDKLSTNGWGLSRKRGPPRPEPVAACPELAEGGEREWIIIKEKLYHPGPACTLLAQNGRDCKRNVLVWKESPLEKRWCFLRVGVSPQDI
jgi:hypothetical protein